jgi:FKBP-type peptidyl-prolyl cis-trans isomerase SlpA
MIKEVSEKSVLVDFNHPLAGHELIYRVKILDVSE